MSNPRVATLHGSDVIGLLASGSCFGFGLALLITSLIFRRRVSDLGFIHYSGTATTIMDLQTWQDSLGGIMTFNPPSQLQEPPFPRQKLGSVRCCEKLHGDPPEIVVTPGRCDPWKDHRPFSFKAVGVKHDPPCWSHRIERAQSA